MTVIFANKVRLPNAWANNVRLEIVKGRIASVSTEVSSSEAEVKVDCLLPSLANLHSHSFQRAMAGMTEFRAAGKDSFWTWRELMYRFVEKLTPETCEAFAALVFMEMLEAGYASVGEFHYLHHQSNGKSYDQLSELSQRVFAAASLSGIGLTHLPVLYTYGGAGKQALSKAQQRFRNDIDQFSRLVSDATENASLVDFDTRVGIAPHSLRATAPDELAQVLGALPDRPVHIHIAEQVKEVADIQSWLGARPVEWLLQNIDVDGRWCLVHATHMTEAETSGLAHSGAVAGLCPITEANLGDGPFNGPTYLAHKGRFGIGSDSNIHISLTEELRTLEYSQRLRDMQRNVLVNTQGSVGETLYLSAAIGGAQALGRHSGKIEPGMLADLVAIDTGDVSLCALSNEQLLDGLCFAASDRVVTDVWSAGRHQVRHGKHVKRDLIQHNYASALKKILSTR